MKSQPNIGLPWSAIGGRILDSTGRLILSACIGQDTSEMIAVANELARRTVQAMNSQQALVAACELFERLLHTDYGRIGEERACNADYLAKVERAQAGQILRAALAKAKT